MVAWIERAKLNNFRSDGQNNGNDVVELHDQEIVFDDVEQPETRLVSFIYL
jgi:hypothetical protein